jgi:gluconolactonase
MAIAHETPFIAYDASFRDVVGHAPRLTVAVETDAHEGPVYVVEEDALYFTTVPRTHEGGPRVSVKRVALDGDMFPLERDHVTVVREETNAANGMTLRHDGTLVVCEQGTRASAARIAALDPRTGETATIVDAWRGVPFNSPNDVVVKSDGTIWFTDPSYGFLQGFRDEPRAGDYVYRYDPRAATIDVVADSFDKPNGLAFSPDETVLYVGDSGANHEPGTYDPRRAHRIVAFDVRDGRRLERDRLFAVTAPGFPDGLKVDDEGRVYASSFDGVLVFAPTGELLGEIAIPGAVNFAFAGSERNVLLVTTDDAVWAAALAATGGDARERAFGY